MKKRKIIEELEKLKEELTVISSKKLIDNETSFLKTEKYQIILKSGAIFPRERLYKNIKGEKRDGNAAVIVPITKDNKSLVIVQPRVFKEERIAVEVPAGYIDPNETAKEAAIRELYEETGYVAKEMIELKSYYQDPGIGGAKNTCFLALDCEKVGHQELDKDEFIKYLECDLSDLYYLVDNDIINDVNGIIAINEVKKYLNLKKVNDNN